MWIFFQLLASMTGTCFVEKTLGTVCTKRLGLVPTTVSPISSQPTAVW